MENDNIRLIQQVKGMAAVKGTPETNNDPRNPIAQPDLDLTDLPPEVLSQLSIKHQRDQVLLVLGSGAEIDLDQILVGLYRRFKVVGKRPIIANKVYRLMKAGLCRSVSRGVYQITETGRATL